MGMMEFEMDGKRFYTDNIMKETQEEFVKAREEELFNRVLLEKRKLEIEELCKEIERLEREEELYDMFPRDIREMKPKTFPVVEVDAIPKFAENIEEFMKAYGIAPLITEMAKSKHDGER